MEYLLESWSLVIILISAFVIGWAAETAQTFMSRALALTILAWLQTLPEFAVEAAIAWHQEKDLMIANLTGSLRLLVGLGWPMIFFTYFFFQGVRHRKFIKEIRLDDSDSMGVFFLFLSTLYFVIVVVKDSLTCWDSLFLSIIYFAYLIIVARQPAHEVEEEEDLPWIGKQIVRLEPVPKVTATSLLFIAGGAALYFSAHPFVETLQKWSAAFGISTFVFVQWVAPFLSEFPEKVSAFNWARQKGKSGMAVMNMVNSNINQWTMLAAMIPIVYNISLGRFEPIVFDDMHRAELTLTMIQSILGGILLLDLQFSIVDASIIFVLWLVQFVYAPLREEVMWAYVVWIAKEVVVLTYLYATKRHLPRAIEVLISSKKKK